MKNGAITLTILILLLTLLLTGCSVENSANVQDKPAQSSNSIPPQSDTATPSIVKEKEPSYIGNFRVQESDNYIEVIFSLYDEKEDFMSANGYANFKIESDDDKTLYTENHRVLKAGFSEFTQTLTGAEFTAYSWRIEKSKIEKSSSWSGNAYLEFRTDDDSHFEMLDTTVLGLPEYSVEELSAIADEEFEKTSISLNIKKKIDWYITVTVEKIGLINFMDYSGKKKLIRVDIVVENTGDEKISYYSPNPVILGKSNNQFEEAYVSSDVYENVFESGDIHPGVIKKGSIFLETKGNPELDLKELIIETGLSSYSEQVRSIGSGQALLYDKEYVFKYDLSNINLK